MGTPPSPDIPLAQKFFCPTCKGTGEVTPAIVINGIKSVVCPTCKGYGAPKPPAKSAS